MSEAVSYTFVWHTSHDPCPICQALDGQKFTDQDLFANLLFDNTGKPIWMLDADHSLAHGYERFNCQCDLEIQVNVDMTELEEINALQTAVDIIEG